MRKRVATMVAVAALLAGCGGGVEGSPVAAERWDPCSIPAEALEAAGLDPNSLTAGWGDGISVPDWSMCRFEGAATSPTYFFNIKSSDVHTFSEDRENVQNLEGADLKIEGRDAFRYKTALSKSITDCNIAMAASRGIVVFTVNSKGTQEIGADPCDLVSSLAADFERFLPPAEN